MDTAVYVQSDLIRMGINAKFVVMIIVFNAVMRSVLNANQVIILKTETAENVLQIVECVMLLTSAFSAITDTLYCKITVFSSTVKALSTTPTDHQLSNANKTAFNVIFSETASNAKHQLPTTLEFVLIAKDTAKLVSSETHPSVLPAIKPSS